ncbi:hypothetical protein, partial [Gemmatimonas sp.]|uniref:hypothetical protein n=1 Tax=Gemmatimonas sp. TaxID=1962908 RepID=UPI0037BFA85E
RVVSGGAACASHAGDGAALLPSAKYDKNRRYENRNDDGEGANKSASGQRQRGHLVQDRRVPQKSQVVPAGWGLRGPIMKQPCLGRNAGPGETPG